MDTISGHSFEDNMKLSRSHTSIYIDNNPPFWETDILVVHVNQLNKLTFQLHQLADEQHELDRGDAVLGALHLLFPLRPRRRAPLLLARLVPAFYHRHLRPPRPLGPPIPLGPLGPLETT